MSFDWEPYVPMAKRRRRAANVTAILRQQGKTLSPVVSAGRQIASTFWGKAWCDNLERYSDFANRLPRGRTYLRNGSVIDLQIGAGDVTAKVMGSMLYDVSVKVTDVPGAHWQAIGNDCASSIDSLVALLQGQLSQAVMERICRQGAGLFPSPTEVEFRCSCPDSAQMCKHVAAVFYGIGARLDAQPELLFTLRKVDAKDLVARADKGLPLPQKEPRSRRVLDSSKLSELFGIEIADVPAAPAMRTRARVPAGGADGKPGAAIGKTPNLPKMKPARRSKRIAR